MAWFVNWLLWWNIYLSYKLYVNLLQNEWIMFSLDDLINSGKWKSMVKELLINLIWPIPLLVRSKYSDLYGGEYNVAQTYANSPLLWACLILRTYHIVATFLENSRFMSSRAFRVGESMWIRVSYKFAFKSIFRDNSLKVVFYITLYTILIFGYMLRIVELPNKNIDPSKPEMNMKNAIWSAIVSMTTLGYGDVIPYTGTGSLIGLGWSVTGIQITAFFLVSFTRFFKFSGAEKFSYELRENIDKSEDIKKKAMNHIVSFYKYKHRNTEKGKQIFRNTHSYTWNLVDIWKIKWIEFNNYCRHFYIFRKENRNHKIHLAQK